MTDFTPQSALAHLLTHPLRFGDLNQIEAHRILRLAEELLDGPYECWKCGGTGEEDEEPGHCDKCGRECSCCSPSETCRVCNGSGEAPWDRTIVYGMQASNIEQHCLKRRLVAA